MTLTDWKRLEITQVIMAEFKRRLEYTKEELAKDAGREPLMDRYRVGAIAAYQDFLDIELDEETQI